MRGRTKILICFWFICCFWCGLFVSLYGGVPWTQKPRSYLYPAGNQSYQGFPLLSTHVKRLGMSDVPSSLDLRTVFGSRFLSHHLLFYLVLYTYKYHVCTLSSCPSVQSFIHPFIGFRKHVQVPCVHSLELPECSVVHLSVHWAQETLPSTSLHSLSLELPKCSVIHPSVHWVQEIRTSTMSSFPRAAQMFSRSSIRSLGSGNTHKTCPHPVII